MASTSKSKRGNRTFAERVEDVLLYIEASDARLPKSVIYGDLGLMKFGRALLGGDGSYTKPFLAGMRQGRWNAACMLRGDRERYQILSGVTRHSKGKLEMLTTTHRVLNSGSVASHERRFWLPTGRFDMLRGWETSMPLPTVPTSRFSSGGFMAGKASTLTPEDQIAAPLVSAAYVCVSLMWTVSFSCGQSAMVLITDATGAAELLRHRERNPGHSRRHALLHWVSEHYRKNRKDSGSFHVVRKHLRGSRQCEWFGMTATIEPSIPDRLFNKEIAAWYEDSRTPCAK